MIVFFMMFLLTFSVCFAKNYETTTNCAEYAINAADAEEAHYGSMSASDWDDAALWYYDACEDANGDIEDPVFN